MMTPTALLAHAKAAPGSIWAYDYLAHALEAYDQRIGENTHATLIAAARLCGHEGGPCIAWARKRVGQYAAGFGAVPSPLNQKEAA